MAAGGITGGFAVGPRGQFLRGRGGRALDRGEAAQALGDAGIVEAQRGQFIAGQHLAQQCTRRVFQHHAQHVQAGGGGLHAGGAGDRLRPGRQRDLGDARIVQHAAAAFERAQHLIGIVVDEPRAACIRASLVGRRQRGADHRGRLTAFGDGEYQVLRPDAVVLQLQAADLGNVLEAFQRGDQRAVAAGDLAAHAFAQAGEARLDLRHRGGCRGALPERAPQPAFDGLGQASGGAGAVEIQAVSVAQGAGDLAAGVFQRRQARGIVGDALQRGRNVLIHRQQRGQPVGGVGGDARTQVEAARMTLLGQQAVQLELLLVRHEVPGLRRRRDAQAVRYGLRAQGQGGAGHDKEGHAAHDAFRHTGHRVPH